MKDFSGEIEYHGKQYKLVFNLNAMMEIQEEYGSLDKWAQASDGTDGEPDIRAILVGFQAMLNEGLDIEADQGKKVEYFNLKQVGRLLQEVGLDTAKEEMDKTVEKSTKSEEKKG